MPTKHAVSIITWSLQEKRIKRRIPRLFNNQGQWIENQEGIANTFLEHFKVLFTEHEPVHEQEIKRKITSLNIPKLIETHLDVLNKPFTAKKMKTIAFQIRPLKTLGINGKLGIFYHRYWNIVGDFTTVFTLSCLNSRYLLKELNKTLIALIPKMNNPNRVSHYRPKSLCNVAYKIISKQLLIDSNL